MIRLDISDLLVIVGVLITAVSLWLLNPILDGAFIGGLLLFFGIARAK